MNPVLKLVINDITTLDVDAIDNAADRSLLGGGGVDGTIHRAAGSGLLKACKKLNGCQTGNVKITAGFNLNARFVIHPVGPIWQGGSMREYELLANCYRNSLRIAEINRLKTIAFPSFSTGA